MGEGEPVKAFTTIGRVTSDAPYRVDMDYLTRARPAPIKPLLDALALTRHLGANRGIAMRGPKRQLDDEDMRTIARAMGVLDDLEKALRYARPAIA